MQNFFGKHLKQNPPEQNEVYELKITSGTSIPFKAVQDHQVDALMEADRGSFYHRITDQPVFGGMSTRFHVRKPFDCMSLSKSKAYVVVWFYKPRKPKVFIKIRINHFIVMKEFADRKSLTEEMALDVGERIPLTIT